MAVGPIQHGGNIDSPGAGLRVLGLVHYRWQVLGVIIFLELDILREGRVMYD